MRHAVEGVPFKAATGGSAHEYRERPRRADGDELTAVGLTFENITNGLRAWRALQPAWVGAAVELLIWHESWLRRRDFLTDVTSYLPDDCGAVGIRWSKVEAFLEPGPRASSRNWPSCAPRSTSPPTGTASVDSGTRTARHLRRPSPQRR